MPDLPPFPDEVAALLVHLADLAETVSFAQDVAQRMPLILVNRFGGNEDRITNSPVVGVDVFAGTYDEGERLTARVHERIMNTPAAVTTPSGVIVIDFARNLTLPVEVAWGDSAVRRWTGSYRLDLRRPVTGP